MSRGALYFVDDVFSIFTNDLMMFVGSCVLPRQEMYFCLLFVGCCWMNCVRVKGLHLVVLNLFSKEILL